MSGPDILMLVAVGFVAVTVWAALLHRNPKPRPRSAADFNASALLAHGYGRDAAPRDLDEYQFDGDPYKAMADTIRAQALEKNLNPERTTNGYRS